MCEGGKGGKGEDERGWEGIGDRYKGGGGIGYVRDDGMVRDGRLDGA